MPLIQWSDEFVTGNTRVDAQHQELFRLVNGFHDAIALGQGKETLGPTLESLAQYVLTHFSAEESLMQSANYPDFVRHKGIHDKLAADAKSIIEGYKSGKNVLSVTLSKFLADWIQSHIRNEDKKMIAFVSAKN